MAAFRVAVVAIPLAALPPLERRDTVRQHCGSGSASPCTNALPPVSSSCFSSASDCSSPWPSPRLADIINHTRLPSVSFCQPI